MRKLAKKTFESLEKIVVNNCSDKAIHEFYKKTGHEKKRLEIARTIVEKERLIAQFSSNSPRLIIAISYNLPEKEIKSIAKQAFQSDIRTDDFELQFSIIETGYHKVSAKKIQKLRLDQLLSKMKTSIFYEERIKEYKHEVQKYAKNLPEEKVKKTAEKALRYLNAEKKYFSAAILAQMYFNKEKVNEQSVKLISDIIEKRKRCLYGADLESYVKIFKIPKKIQKQLAVHLFFSKFRPEEFKNKEAKQFIKDNDIPADKINKILKNNYNIHMQNAQFKSAYGLRKEHDIQDSQISLKQLTTLVNMFY